MDPTDDKANYKWGIFYFHAGDRRAIVPKRERSLGFTINFARPEASLVILVFVLLFAIVFALLP